MTEPTPAPKVGARLAKITPAVAVKLLARNTHNRGISRPRIAQYAADIRNGDWQVNGESIKLSFEGQILDGQHRLLAIIEADMAIETILITNLHPRAQETMDQGRLRSVGDVLKLRGEKDYYNLGAALRIVCLYERDGVPYASGRPVPTIGEILRTLDRHPEARGSVTRAGRDARPWVTRSTVAGMHCLFSMVDRRQADEFVDHLLGKPAEWSPAVELRGWLIAAREAGVHTRARQMRIVQAWNAYRAGVLLPPDLPDTFPVVAGLEALGRGGRSSQDPPRPALREVSRVKARILQPRTGPQDEAARAMLEAAS